MKTIFNGNFKSKSEILKINLKIVFTRYISEHIAHLIGTKDLIWPLLIGREGLDGWPACR